MEGHPRIGAPRPLVFGPRPFDRRSTFFSTSVLTKGMPRPVAAGVLTIIGGIFILLVGLVIAAFGALFAFLGFFSGLFFIGAAVGFLTIIVGVLMLAVPSAHLVWGILAVVLAVVSLPFALGGLIIGFLLALIGGILAAVWKRPVERVINVQGQTVPPPPR